MRGKIFNEEKVLYFAEREGAFHIQPNEPKDSDCRQIVRKLMGEGCLEVVEESGAGRFFRITNQGKAKLLKLQIQWRRSNGKDVSEHEQKLRDLQADGAVQ